MLMKLTNDVKLGGAANTSEDRNDPKGPRDIRNMAENNNIIPLGKMKLIHLG